MASCDKIVMVSNGEGDVGAGKVTGEILDIVAKLPKAVEALTGVDISKVSSSHIVCRESCLRVKNCLA